MTLFAQLLIAGLFCVAFYRYIWPLLDPWIDDKERYWHRLVAMYAVGALFTVGILMLPEIAIGLMGDSTVAIRPLPAFAWRWARAANLLGLACLGFCVVGDGIVKLLDARDKKR